ncbi:hypothetical protein H2200_011534 [Cladophialophora chaetospira]|uniref:Peptide N-acetyl-beta-D-glucosaminyl asparaginase amidase A N-terminal domain-containing protein n=1 Tax=Cladophialophora chaetospira TaxID=386627 RepID=A0AA39CDB5_9EURO|nr:hypothetical protein H2200_011534 [Cladophialophora chaetospira]
MRVLEPAVVAAATSVLRVFQVSTPVLAPPNLPQAVPMLSSNEESSTTSVQGQSCNITQTLMMHSFGNSYGHPFVGYYDPPQCSFNHITLNLTVEATGRQFDRLAVAYLGDVEFWRTSTAEPTSDGIVWTHIKDVSHLLSLFSQPQELTFDLGNLVNDKYTSPFNATLQATFFEAADTVRRADLVLPIPARRMELQDKDSGEHLQANVGDSIVLPQNIERAIFTISASGQMDEEFWYSNVFSSHVRTFGSDPMPGQSAFREVQLLIDDNLAGVAWPFPIVFTGGIVPGLWRPIVGIDTFDIREDEIDITPWLPLLCDGKSHSFQIRVVGINDDGHDHGHISDIVGNYWVVTGKIFLWLDHDGSVTSGTYPASFTPSPSLVLFNSIGTSPNGTNQTLTNVVDATRDLTVSSQVKTSKGKKTSLWQQTLSYSNWNDLYDFGVTQVVAQHTSGSATSSEGYSRSFSYPLFVNSTTIQNKAADSLFISATVNRGLEIETVGQSVFSSDLKLFDNSYTHGSRTARPRGPDMGTRLITTQNGSAIYFRHGNVSFSPATTQQDLVLSHIVPGDSKAGSTKQHDLYRRHVLAVNDTLVEDQETYNAELSQQHHNLRQYELGSV